jgi:hypothetical protein
MYRDDFVGNNLSKEVQLKDHNGFGDLFPDESSEICQCKFNRPLHTKAYRGFTHQESSNLDRNILNALGELLSIGTTLENLKMQ